MMSSSEPISVIASTSSVPDDATKGTISFQYCWPLRVCERLLENREAAVLNVSPPFTTAYNGVQFTWALRLSDECVVTQSDSSGHVFVLLYFKNGPCSDVSVEEVRATVCDPQSGAELFKDLQIGPNEFTRGSGWPIQVGKERQPAFSDFIRKRVNTQLNIIVTIKMNSRLFEPLKYLPDAETSQRIEGHCVKFIDNLDTNTLRIPNLPLQEEDKFSRHRLVFLFGCDEVERECIDGDEDPSEHFLNLVKSTFARVYFKMVLMKEVEYFDDFLALLEGVILAHIPPLKKEMERFLCREVLETTDLEFTKKMVLLAEKHSLEVLKMVAAGVLVDQIIGHSNPPAELVNITHDLQQFAAEIQEITNHDPTPADDALVGSVVQDLQSLTRRVRRVSLSHSPSVSSQGSSPSATPTETESLSPAISERDERPFDQGRFKKVEIV